MEKFHVIVQHVKKIYYGYLLDSDRPSFSWMSDEVIRLLKIITNEKSTSGLLW